MREVLRSIARRGNWH